MWLAQVALEDDEICIDLCRSSVSFLDHEDLLPLPSGWAVQVWYQTEFSCCCCCCCCSCFAVLFHTSTGGNGLPNRIDACSKRSLFSPE